MATPHHRTFPTEEQRRRRPQRSLLHRTRLQRPRLPTASHKLHAAACAVLCGGTPRACHPASVVVVACESGQRDSTACARRAPSQWLRAHPSAPTARPPPCTAHPAAHTSSRDTSPHGCRCIVPLRTHAPLAARGRSDAGSARTLWTWRSPAARPWNLTAVQRIVCSTSCISHQLATSRHLQAPEPSTH